MRGSFNLNKKIIAFSIGNVLMRHAEVYFDLILDN